jgi:hypothetical protein
MLRLLRVAVVAMLPGLALGCQNLSPALDMPPVPRTPLAGAPIAERNPAYIPLPPEKYNDVYGAILESLHDYGFEIAETNRYSGHVEAVPRIAPGVLLFFKPGSPDIYDRLLCTAQTYRHRVTVNVQPSDVAPADHLGFEVEFIVRKELEDLARPLRSTVGGAVFRSENTVERQTEVIDATFFEPNWIYRGRDCALEQELIRRFKRALASAACRQ